MPYCKYFFWYSVIHRAIILGIRAVKNNLSIFFITFWIIEIKDSLWRNISNIIFNTDINIIINIFFKSYNIAFRPCSSAVYTVCSNTGLRVWSSYCYSCGIFLDIMIIIIWKRRGRFINLINCYSINIRNISCIISYMNINSLIRGNCFAVFSLPVIWTLRCAKAVCQFM